MSTAPALDQWNDGLTKAMLSEWTLGLVQKAIFCPFTGNVLDIRTCHVIVDQEGDPVMPVAPEFTDAVIQTGKAADLAEKNQRWVIRRNDSGDWEVVS